MSHYAKVENNIVTQVIVAEQDHINTLSGQWIQTSYNTRNGIHFGSDGKPDGGVALRGNYAGIGYIYDQAHDVFYAPQPFPSWKLNTITWSWNAPKPYPTDKKYYQWNESTQTWVKQKDNSFQGNI